MRRLLKMAMLGACAIVVLIIVLAGAAMVAGNTDSGRGLIERLTYRLSAGYVKLSGLGGQFPAQLTLRELQLIDREGVWLTAHNISLTWSPLPLIERRIQIDTLNASTLRIDRAPVSEGGGGNASIPHIEVGRFALGRIELGAPLVGSAVALSAQGDLRLRSLQDANADLIARRSDGDGEYTLHLRIDPKRMDASLVVREPASGPLENLLSMPGLGALSATATLAGPRNAELLDVVLRAGDLQANAKGRVDLTQGSADLEYSLVAPALAPRPDVAWTGIALQGNWHGPMREPQAEARLKVDGLRIGEGTRIARVGATLTGSTGKLAVHALIDGLEIPGAQPRVFATDPLKIDASMQMDAAGRPLALTAVHRLFSLTGTAQTAPSKTGEQLATLGVKLPDVAPFAALTGEDVRGNAQFNAQLVHRSQEDLLTLDGAVDLAGGTAPWIGFAGPRVALQLSGSLSSDSVKIAGMKIAGKSAKFSINGSAERGPAPSVVASLKSLQAHWQLEMSDLAALSSDLAGELKASGSVRGSLSMMAADAELVSQLSLRGSPSGSFEASLEARGLPNAPSGTVRAHGMLDGAPLRLDAALERVGGDAFRVLIRQADWKSAHLEGDLTADPAFTQSHGHLSMHMAELGDLDDFVGSPLSGSLEAGVAVAPGPGRTKAQVHLDGNNLISGQFAGDLHLRGEGVADALALELTANLPNLYGRPARLSSSAELDLNLRRLRLASASLEYRDQTFRLLEPALIEFAKEVAIDDLQIGVQGAVLAVKGQVSPTLDLHATLHDVRPALVNAFFPGVLTSGALDGEMHLLGSASSPTGDLQLDASKVRFADDAATGLPPVDLKARAQLGGDTASVNVALSAGQSSQVSASGSAPLDANGLLNLKIAGKLDLSIANPLLEARGLHAAGEMTADATVTGTAAAPQVGGGITLAGGSLRDYARGVNLSDINAQAVGSQGTLQIQSFTAKAASGTLDMTGSVGILQPGLPLDVRITAKHAQPIASNIVTANLDGDLHISGSARRRLDVAGTIHVNKATIGIPDSLPPDVAVLDVRRRGQPAQTAADQQLVVGIDVTIQAPQEILVQGRGLDAEMGGEIRLSGTSDELLASGGFDLQRGSFTLAGNKLTFTQGRVSFDGAGLRKKIDPTLDFTAQTTLASTTATLRITGVADAPRFDFSSSPVLPQDEIMAQLLFGENAAQLSALQAAQIGAALATLSGVGGNTSNPLTRLQKSLGLDRLTVGANTTNTATGTENSGAAIAAGRYVSKRVYIEGKQSTAGNSQVQVDVDLTKHLKLQTRLGNGSAITQGTTPENDPGSSVGFSYQFEY